METIENIKANHYHLGKKIERVRRLRGMTQTELGQLLGITKQAVSKMEQTEKIDDERLEKIASALGVTTDGLKEYNEETVLYNTNNFYENCGVGMFDGGENYLIDFLDSFIESPLIDIVKLRQDTAFYWSEKMYTNKYDSLRLHLILKILDERICKMASQFAWYDQYYQTFQLMNFWRIMQYATKPEIVEYLKSIIFSLTNIPNKL